jgi:O-acetylserine/cysteine efflux transporter
MTGASAALTRLPASHALLALMVVAIWGTNFVVIRWALEVFTPLWLAVLRFGLVLLPAVPVLVGLTRLGLPRPQMPWRDLLAYGLLVGAGQFSLLYLAMQGHIAPGLASLVIQMQVFFTIGLSMLTTSERLQSYQGVALALAVAGLVLIATHTDGVSTPLGLGMVLLAALSWAGGNIVGRRSKSVSMLHVVVWSCLGALPVLLALALLVEGPAALASSVSHAGVGAWSAVLWQAVGNSLIGYSVWGWLLQRYPAATIVPWALLVPVFGMGSAVLLLNEPMPWWKWLAAALVMGGLGLNVLWPMVRGRVR